ncbi:ATP synthase subunit d, mitochondrial [Zootermopsis nevadensis]|uniref:ATP synthase subunit d, mitochondrial n=1 Tax=Zootermopsis nevadensis TaxID=136037 RepID=A0A067R370_ZOONE|nr:ATP synthase subunit d, mitochondrial [Zootermopsis nevadensis]KDR17560.1 ATP synthase subunit d, mitochondrial [Zootermopsis nevadensis]
MAARRITQSSINWTALAERVPENQKVYFTAFKAKSDGYLRRMMAYPEAAPKINWGYYTTHVPIQGMVDDFRKKYEALNIPYPSDNVTPQIDQQEKEALKEVQEFVKQSDARIAGYEAEIARLKSLLPFEQMTMEDFKDAYPDLALDPLNKPTFWPHTPEEQIDFNDSKVPQEEVHH